MNKKTLIIEVSDEHNGLITLPHAIEEGSGRNQIDLKIGIGGTLYQRHQQNIIPQRNGILTLDAVAKMFESYFKFDREKHKLSDLDSEVFYNSTPFINGVSPFSYHYSTLIDSPKVVKEKPLEELMGYYYSNNDVYPKLNISEYIAKMKRFYNIEQKRRNFRDGKIGLKELDGLGPEIRLSEKNYQEGLVMIDKAVVMFEEVHDNFLKDMISMYEKNEIGSDHTYIQTDFSHKELVSMIEKLLIEKEMPTLHSDAQKEFVNFQHFIPKKEDITPKQQEFIDYFTNTSSNSIDCLQSKTKQAPGIVFKYIAENTKSEFNQIESQDYFSLILNSIEKEKEKGIPFNLIIIDNRNKKTKNHPLSNIQNIKNMIKESNVFEGTIYIHNETNFKITPYSISGAGGVIDSLVNKNAKDNSKDNSKNNITNSESIFTPTNNIFENHNESSSLFEEIETLNYLQKIVNKGKKPDYYSVIYNLPSSHRDNLFSGNHPEKGENTPISKQEMIQGFWNYEGIGGTKHPISKKEIVDIIKATALRTQQQDENYEKGPMANLYDPFYEAYFGVDKRIKQHERKRLGQEIIVTDKIGPPPKPITTTITNYSKPTTESLSSTNGLGITNKQPFENISENKNITNKKGSYKDLNWFFFGNRDSNAQNTSFQINDDAFELLNIVLEINPKLKTSLGLNQNSNYSDSLSKIGDFKESEISINTMIEQLVVSLHTESNDLFYNKTNSKINQINNLGINQTEKKMLRKTTDIVLERVSQFVKNDNIYFSEGSHHHHITTLLKDLTHIALEELNYKKASSKRQPSTFKASEEKISKELITSIYNDFKKLQQWESFKNNLVNSVSIPELLYFFNNVSLTSKSMLKSKESLYNPNIGTSPITRYHQSIKSTNSEKNINTPKLLKITQSIQRAEDFKEIVHFDGILHRILNSDDVYIKNSNQKINVGEIFIQDDMYLSKDLIEAPNAQKPDPIKDAWTQMIRLYNIYYQEEITDVKDINFHILGLTVEDVVNGKSEEDGVVYKRLTEPPSGVYKPDDTIEDIIENFKFIASGATGFVILDKDFTSGESIKFADLNTFHHVDSISHTIDVSFYGNKSKGKKELSDNKYKEYFDYMAIEKAREKFDKTVQDLVESEKISLGSIQEVTVNGSSVSRIENSTYNIEKSTSKLDSDKFFRDIYKKIGRFSQTTDDKSKETKLVKYVEKPEQSVMSKLYEQFITNTLDLKTAEKPIVFFLSAMAEMEKTIDINSKNPNDKDILGQKISILQKHAEKLYMLLIANQTAPHDTLLVDGSYNPLVYNMESNGSSGLDKIFKDNAHFRKEYTNSMDSILLSFKIEVLQLVRKDYASKGIPFIENDKIYIYSFKKVLEDMKKLDELQDSAKNMINIVDKIIENISSPEKLNINTSGKTENESFISANKKEFFLMVISNYIDIKKALEDDEMLFTTKSLGLTTNNIADWEKSYFKAVVKAASEIVPNFEQMEYVERCLDVIFDAEIKEPNLSDESIFLGEDNSLKLNENADKYSLNGFGKEELIKKLEQLSYLTTSIYEENVDIGKMVNQFFTVERNGRKITLAQNAVRIKEPIPQLSEIIYNFIMDSLKEFEEKKKEENSIETRPTFILPIRNKGENKIIENMVMKITEENKINIITTTIEKDRTQTNGILTVQGYYGKDCNKETVDKVLDDNLLNFQELENLMQFCSMEIVTLDTDTKI